MKKIIKKTNIKNNNQGFSLIELMTAIALIGILTSIIITTARFSDTQKNLNLEKNRLQATLRLAQSYSLSIPNTENDNICGFGVEVSSDGKQYNVFYTYEDGSGTTCEDDPLTASASYYFIDIVVIDSDEIIASGNDIFFRAPYGDVFQGGTVELSSSAVSSSTDVTVTSSGQIN